MFSFSLSATDIHKKARHYPFTGQRRAVCCHRAVAQLLPNYCQLRSWGGVLFMVLLLFCIFLHQNIGLTLKL